MSRVAVKDIRCARWPGLNLVRAFAAFTLLFIATSAWPQDYRLPFNGRWFVMQGGDTLNVNDHMAAAAQWYGMDFAKVGGPSRRSLAKSSGTTAEDFYSWGGPVLSPVDGEVVAIGDSLADNALGAKDAQHPMGNLIEIRAANDQYVFLAHMQRHSIAVRPGQRVARGDVLGKCGNSGNTDFPHIHMHVQNAEAFGSGTGQRVEFSEMDVELTGKEFHDVKWPLLRGLFVWNH